MRGPYLMDSFSDMKVLEMGEDKLVTQFVNVLNAAGIPANFRVLFFHFHWSVCACIFYMYVNTLVWLGVHM